jgi:hypothetical protein
MTAPGEISTMHNQTQASAELEQLANALTRHGYHATVITPAPYLAIHIPGATLPHMIYNSGGHFWWHTAQNIALTTQITRAAELITWGLRARPRVPHTTTLPTGHGGGQEC